MQSKLLNVFLVINVRSKTGKKQVYRTYRTKRDNGKTRRKQLSNPESTMMAGIGYKVGRIYEKVVFIARQHTAADARY